MSCPDAPAATIVNSAASSANARTARSVFKTISPPYFPNSLESALWCVRKANEVPPLYYKTHGAPGSFNRQFSFVPDPSVYRPHLDGVLCCQRKARLARSAIKKLTRNIFPYRWPVLEPMPGASACKPHIFHFRMPVDQKIPVRGILILANARFNNRRILQCWEPPRHILLRHLRHRGRNDPRLRVRINALAMLVKRNLQSAPLDVRHSINQVFLKQPSRQRRTCKSHIACRNTEEKYFLPRRENPCAENVRENFAKPRATRKHELPRGNVL